MRFSAAAGLVAAVTATGALARPSPYNPSSFDRRSSNTTEKKYVILDNDWSTAGFIPYLQALNAGWEVLGLTSCRSFIAWFTTSFIATDT